MCSTSGCEFSEPHHRKKHRKKKPTIGDFLRCSSYSIMSVKELSSLGFDVKIIETVFSPFGNFELKTRGKLSIVHHWKKKPQWSFTIQLRKRTLDNLWLTLIFIFFVGFFEKIRRKKKKWVVVATSVSKTTRYFELLIDSRDYCFAASFAVRSELWKISIFLPNNYD